MCHHSVEGGAVNARKKINPNSHEQDNAESTSQPVSLLAFLEAENARLRQTVIELALDTMDVRDALRLGFDTFKNKVF
jgi:hypothetical protein